MDHSDKIKQNLDILGLDSLKGLTIDELLAAVAEKFPPEVSKRRLLNVFVMWLHERLMAVDISAEVAFADEVASWYNALKAAANDDRAIAEAFHDWQREQSIHDAVSSRKLSIVEAELHCLMASPTVRPENNLETPRLENRYGNMHPDRMKLSREEPSVIEIGDDEPEVVEIPFRPWEDRPQPQTDDQNELQDLSFLTGANRLVLTDTVDSELNQEDLPLASCLKIPEREVSSISKRHIAGYLCNRCGIPGHLLRNCPTDMDPDFDQKPDENYVCRICKKVGDHLYILCPDNRDPKSLTQRRRRNAERNSQNRKNHRGDYGRDFDNSRPSCFRNDRLSRFDESPHGRRRSRSPLWNTDGKGRKGMFRPEYEPAIHRSLSPPSRHSDSKRHKEESHLEENPRIHRPSPPQEHRSNRKHLRAVSPEEAAPPRAIHLQSDKRAMKKARKVTFAEDLVIEIKDVGEGRLSYYDVPATPLSALITRSSDGEKMDIDVPDLPVQEKRVEPASEIDGFKDALDKMIKHESTTPELLLLLNGIEIPCPGPIFKFFKGAEERIWFRRDKPSRARPSDFFDLPTECGPDTEGIIKCETPAQDTAIKEREQPWTRITQGNGAVNIDMVLTDRTRQLKDMANDGDAAMTDVEPATAAAGVVEEENSMVETARVHNDRSSLSEAGIGRMEPSPIPVAVMTGTLSRGVTQEDSIITHEIETEEVPAGSLSKVEHSTLNETKSEAEGEIQLSRLVERTAMEVGALPTVAEEPSSCRMLGQSIFGVEPDEVIKESACLSQELSRVALDDETCEMVKGPASIL
ncbi:E3 ubiquitin-protein ligase RBBP6 [Madurella fahalii]|uniref:E3 ubiquitin-protein ligase RBBP6 n=1 Tax=Madurella fahalii TaxID=1157608 RepID=A0ABQ0GMX6_9PEZI